MLLSRRFSLAVRPVLSNTCTVCTEYTRPDAVMSPPIPLFYLCKAWIHEDDICMGFQVHFIDYLPIYYHENTI